MQKLFSGPLPDHGRNIMRRFGYGELRKWNGETSYAKRVSAANFPRYHAYIEDKSEGLQINLHVDQKEASHEGSHAHSGEYDGPLVEAEMAYFTKAITSLKQEQHSSLPQVTTPIEPKKSAHEKKSRFWK
ncbi:MAG: hypothetical protein AAB664_02405 [Patescibacteria group bacterium]